MSHNDGANSISCVREKVSVFVDRFRNRTSVENSKEDSSIEADFKGFEKLPAVVVQPLDITPYLKGKQNARSETRKTLRDLKVFFSKCSVNIVREDLEQLRRSLSSQNSPMVDQSLNMVNLKCKICEKVYSSEKRLQNHQENKHMIIYKPRSTKPRKKVSFCDKVIVHEVKEYHKCRKCVKIFEEYKSLRIHMKLRHKKRKCYICNYCFKKFVDRMFFKVHIKLHCDICRLLLPNKTTYLEHRRNVCRVLKLHKCKSCSSSFYNIMDLKDHGYEHLDMCYVCDVCKDQFPSKCFIAHHMSFLHSKNRPNSLYSMRNLGTERLYLCNFCEESSVDRTLIETHVQTLPDLTNRAMTGYKDYYFCDQCLKKFDTEKEMLQHKWTHFLKTSDNSQLRPKGILMNKNEGMNGKTKFKLGEKLPDLMQPKIVLEKIRVGDKILTEEIAFVDVKSFDVNHGEIKKPVVHPKSKKTIISKHQCTNCGKYYSSNYSLNRHIETQHSDFENFQCNICEETFVWPSLLKSHKCIRLKLPEMPFDDARPEIHFSNLQELTPNGFDDLNIVDNDDYMQTLDFEIPAPIVEHNEHDSCFVNGGNVRVSETIGKTLNEPFQSIGYKIVMQEVPIEF